MRWWHVLRARLEMLLFREDEETALEEEIRFHLEMETRKLESQGYAPSEARRLARVRFGGEDRMKERTREERGTRWLEDMGADLRHGARVLRRSPGFALGAVLALALGIGSSTASYSLVKRVLLDPLPWADADQLVELRELGEGRTFYPSYPNFDDWRARSSTLELMSVQPLGEVPVEGPEGPFRARVLGISRDFFETLGLPPERGRTFLDTENAPGGAAVVMVSHAFWRDRLGAPADLNGVSLRTYGDDYLVVGVASAEHRFVEEADLFIPMERWPGTIRSAHAYRVFGRLGPDVTLARAKEDMDAVAAAIQVEYPGESQAEAVQIRSLPDVMLGDYRRPLSMLLGAAALVLLVVALNVGSTLLARGMDRSRELSVRASLGASRSRLVRQLLLEALVLAALGGVAGVALASGFVGAAVRLAPDVLPRVDTVSIDGGVLGFALLITLGTTVLCGLFPALRLTRSGSTRGPGMASRSATRHTRGWGWLLALEAALAVVLLVGGGLMLRSVRHIVEAPPNWNPDGVLEVRFGFPSGMFDSEEAGVAFVHEMLAEAAAIPGVEAVSVTNRTPLGGGDYVAPARDPSKEHNPDNYTGFRVVDRDYFRTLEIPLLQGRLWEAGEADAAVVNEELAQRLWPGEDPLGRLVTNNYDYRAEPFRVVGVVADARDWRMDPEDQTEMYVPWWSRPEHATTMSLVIRASAGDPSALVPAIRARLSAVGPRVAWEMRPLSEALTMTAGDRRFVSAILVAFAGIGAFEALVGIFGIVGYSVSRRRREFGVRMALGARATGIRGEILSALARSVLPGVLLGLLMAAMLSRALVSLLYEVSPLDMSVYAAVAVAFAFAALLAGDLPARRAARTDPADVLRQE